MFAGNFAPSGFALCNGQLLPISQNTALFSLLGTFYGGNGTSNFALPNLQASVPMGTGNGAGLSQHVIGETGGEATVTLLNQSLPQHQHALQAFAGRGGINVNVPASGAAITAGQGGVVYAAAAAPVAMNAQTIAPAGGGNPHNNLMPCLAVTFIIALQGIFPPRG
jgi:microcystin-dependent protein